MFLFLFRKAARTETEKTLTKNTSESYPYLTILQSKMQYKKQRPKITHENQINYKQKIYQEKKIQGTKKEEENKVVVLLVMFHHQIKKVTQRTKILGHEMTISSYIISCLLYRAI